MMCEKCGKKEATFYYRENVNGTEKNYRLCADCAARMQKDGEIKSFTGGSLFGKNSPFAQMEKMLAGDDFFGSLLGSPAREKTAEQKKCGLCGSLFSDLVKTGKAGCPACYETFAEELAPSVQRIHGRTVHTGQVPARFREENDKKQKIAALETELKEAIRTENYERAAEIRDTLRDLRDAQ